MFARTYFSFRLFVSFILLKISSTASFVGRLDQCEPIQIPQCRAMPYNMTKMPNLLYHNTQENAKLAFEQFEILLEQNCSDVLLFFLCSIYVPICTIAFQQEPIPPCKGVCEKARAGCEPLMNAYNVSWPDALDCSRLPRYERGVCVSPEAIVSPSKPKVCKCKRRLKASWRNYRKHRYDYAIRAVVRRKKKYGNQIYRVKVKVISVLKCGKVKFPLDNEMDLWTNSSCLCPALKRGREYLIMGKEDRRNGRLLFLPQTVACRWKDKWANRIQKWERRLYRPRVSRRRQNKLRPATNSMRKKNRGRSNRITSRRKSSRKNKKGFQRYEQNRRRPSRFY